MLLRALLTAGCFLTLGKAGLKNIGWVIFVKNATGMKNKLTLCFFLTFTFSTEMFTSLLLYPFRYIFKENMEGWTKPHLLAVGCLLS